MIPSVHSHREKTVPLPQRLSSAGIFRINAFCSCFSFCMCVFGGGGGVGAHEYSSSFQDFTTIEVNCVHFGYHR